MEKQVPEFSWHSNEVMMNFSETREHFAYPLSHLQNNIAWIKTKKVIKSKCLVAALSSTHEFGNIYRAVSIHKIFLMDEEGPAPFASDVDRCCHLCHYSFFFLYDNRQEHQSCTKSSTHLAAHTCPPECDYASLIHQKWLNVSILRVQHIVNL